MKRTEALQIIWNRCQHSKETEEALEVIKAEQPHGKWNVIKSKSETAAVIGVCSNCGFGNFFVDGDTSHYSFCPKCGSDNRREQTNEM